MVGGGAKNLAKSEKTPYRIRYPMFFAGIMKVKMMCCAVKTGGRMGGTRCGAAGGPQGPRVGPNAARSDAGPTLGPCPMRPPSPRSGGPPKRGPSEGRLSFRPKAGSPARGSVPRGVRAWIS